MEQDHAQDLEHMQGVDQYLGKLNFSVLEPHFQVELFHPMVQDDLTRPYDLDEEQYLVANDDLVEASSQAVNGDLVGAFSLAANDDLVEASGVVVYGDQHVADNQAEGHGEAKFLVQLPELR